MTRRFFFNRLLSTGFFLAFYNVLFAKKPKNPIDERLSAVNPWLELSKNAYLTNAQSISKMVKGIPILAVLKNNAYGLGDVQVAKILDESNAVSGFALVKDERCIALRKAGVLKPILLMGDFAPNLGMDLIRSNITLSVFSMESLKKIKLMALHSEKQIKVQLYFDTGLGRMGIPYYQNLKWVKDLLSIKNVSIVGVFSTLVTSYSFSLEQLRRFKSIKEKLEKIGVSAIDYHLAPSFSLLRTSTSHLDMVRPGILLHGTYPLAKMQESEEYPLIPTYKLKARVIRVERLRKGDTIGFSRFYKIEEDEWIATLPIGWADGYDSRAENGAMVMINDKLYDVVNVNASHCNIKIGPKKEFSVGDIATLIGPEVPEITPEGFGLRLKGNNYMQIQYKESIPKIVYDEFL